VLVGDHLVMWCSFQYCPRSWSRGPAGHARAFELGPDVFGSICFLVSGAIANRASARHGWLPARGRPGLWEPSINLLGCVFFGISAIAGYLVPSTGSLLKLAAANSNTALGAACFLTCALATLLTGRTHKSPPLRRLHTLEKDVERHVERIV
jgi:hypothetical protein